MPLDVVTRTRGFIRDNYVKHLRGAEGLIVSRYDVAFHRRRSASRKRDAARPGPAALDAVARL